MAGSRPSRRCGRAARTQPDRAPQRAVDGGLPGGLVEVLESPGRRSAGVDDEQVEPAECRRPRPPPRARALAAWRGRRGPPGHRSGPRPHRASPRAGRSARRPAPSARSAVAIAPPSPPLPPPTSARAPSSPRSIARWYGAAPALFACRRSTRAGAGGLRPVACPAGSGSRRRTTGRRRHPVTRPRTRIARVPSDPRPSRPRRPGCRPRHRGPWATARLTRCRVRAVAPLPSPTDHALSCDPVGGSSAPPGGGQ